MHERKKLNKLVIMELSNNEIHVKASTLYYQLKDKDPSIMRKEKVKGFRSFVKVLNSFDGVEAHGSGVKKYGITNRC